MSGVSTPYSTSSAPPPPPKPTVQSREATPSSTMAPRPPPPIPARLANSSGAGEYSYVGLEQEKNLAQLQSLQGPPEGWLPHIVNEKSTVDLHGLISSPELQHALVHSADTRHQSLPISSTQLQALLDANVALATELTQLEAQVQSSRQNTQSRLLTLRALDRQWKAKEGEQDEALRDFSAPVLYQRLNAAVGEQEMLCRAMEESFLEGEDGAQVASEREVVDYVRRLKDARKIAYIRRERKERWDEGRIGGWRG